MTTVAPDRPRPVVPRTPLPPPRAALPRHRRRHWLWLAAGLVLAFAVPFMLADTLELGRDLYYGLYTVFVITFAGAWAWHTGLGHRDLARNWRWGLVLGAAGAAAMALVVVRTEDATDRPGGLELAGAVLWRGVVYGAADGVLLSVFPILAVFAALAGTRLRRHAAGTLAVGALALLASLGITASYHLGYEDFRSEKLRTPLAGDVLWSAPTLLTLSPLGAPLAHVGLHVAAVVHSYDTETFLPPHRAAAAEDVPAPAVEARLVSVYFLRGEVLAPASRTAAGAAVATEALGALLAGPTAAERKTGLASAIPAGTDLRSVAVDGGTATVDLSGTFETGGGSLSMAARLAQVTYTLTQFPTVERVVYELDGVPLTVLGGEGILLEEPQSRALYEQGRPDSLESSLLGPVFVEAPAQGTPFESPLRVTGSATGPFTLTVTDWDGRIVAEEDVAASAGARTSFDVTLAFEPGLYPRGALIAAAGETVVEIPLGR
ncbi:MAG TPA: GerMN domain-containing protein [Gaiellaceae bacterium]|nr:GerMN domain-containing protein [Gaiellaceae bacterium]